MLLSIQVYEVVELLANYVDEFSGGSLKNDPNRPYSTNARVRTVSYMPYVQHALYPEVCYIHTKLMIHLQILHHGGNEKLTRSIQLMKPFVYLVIAFTILAT